MPVHQYSKQQTKEAPPQKPEPDLSTATGRARFKGYMGGARKIRVQSVPGSESSFVGPFVVGLLGPFTLRRGFDIIVPDEVVEAFNSSNSCTKLECDFDSPDRRSGNIPVFEVPIEPRFPYVDYGPETWENYEAFLEEQKKKPNRPTPR